MPTYQYACTECGHRFEAVQSFSDQALSTCPVCSGALRKVFSSVGVVFKGSGFYRTDSRGPEKKTVSDKPAADSSKKSESTKSETSASSSSSSSSDSSSSSKPAASSTTTTKAAAP